ncbi:hypothetical protein BDK51DRAFT_8734, partial [Blyttiomyces helicus]
DLRTNYIGTADPNAPFGTRCKHGAAECLGNIQQLCTRAHYPSPSQWFNFILCENRNWRSIPDAHLGASCAAKFGIDYDVVRGCMDGDEGVQLLAESVAATKAAGAGRSCTIFIDGKKRCIHDGDWDECDAGHSVADFVRDI